jgi:hypothetical protein
MRRRIRPRSSGPVIVRPTKPLVYAAAMDNAKAHMRAHGRAAMAEEDAEVYVAAFDRMFHDLGGVGAWLAMPGERP